MIAAPEVRRLRLRPGDAAIILASDGLWDVMDDSEAVDVVEKVRTFAGFCKVGIYGQLGEESHWGSLSTLALIGHVETLVPVTSYCVY